MRCRHRALGVLAGLLAVHVVAGAAAAQEPAEVAFGVTRWSTADGLPSHFVPEIVQTSDGFLWVVAGGSLVRFDGISFQEMATADADAMGYVTGVAAGTADTLWLVGATGRVASLSDRRFSVVDSLAPLIGSVVQGGDGRLWVSATLEAWVRGPSGFESLGPTVLPLPSVLQGRYLWADALGRAWTLTGPGHGARRLDDGGAAVTPLSAETVIVPFPSANMIMEARHSSGRVELLDEDGVLRFAIPAEDRTPRLVDGQGRLWVTAPGGLEVYSGLGAEPVTVTLGDPALYVHTVLEAEGGSFWAGTHEQGLFRIQAQSFRTFLSGSGGGASQVRTVSRGAEGTVLAADVAGAVTRLGGAVPERVLPPGSGAYVAYEDSRGTLWLGQFEERDLLVGLPTDGPEIRVPVTPRPTLIREDPRGEGTLWFAADGLYRYEPYRGGEPQLVLGTEWGVRDLAFGPEGEVWVVGRAGVARITPDGVRPYRAADGYPVERARAVHVDDRGDVWVGTYRSGLIRIRAGEFAAVRMADGLREDVVSDILPDDAGNLWMAGNRSVHRVAIDEVNAFLDGSVDVVVGVGYGRNDGMPNPETSGLNGVRDRSGRLWFPTFDGVAMVDPSAALGLEQDPPGIVLDGIRVNGEPAALERRMELAARERRLDIRYAGIYLRDPQGLRYEVRLDGLDPAWSDVGTLREVHYASLGPGSYTFRVRAINSSGVKSTAEATLDFTIEPLFRETRWFPFLGVLALSLVVVIAWRLRVGALEARQVMLTHRVEERTRELTQEQRRTRAQAQEIHELNQARSRFFTNLSHELRTPLTLILGPLADLEAGRGGALAEGVLERIRAVAGSGRRLNRVVDQLMDLARLESGRMELHTRVVDGVSFLERIAAAFRSHARDRGIDFTVEFPDTPMPVDLDPEQADKIFVNILGNAFKFTPEGGHVALRAQKIEGEDGPLLTVEVEDDGPGIAADRLDHVFDRFHRADDAVGSGAGAGIGLDLTRDLVEMHRGTIQVSSEFGGGSLFTVSLPMHADGEPIDLERMPVPSVQAEWENPGAEPSEPPASAASAADPDEDQPTVLLVEDHDELRGWMRSHLAGEYRVVEAADGLGGLEEARRVTPDVIVTDVMMPGMSGAELCRAVKADPELSYVSVILVTAKGARESKLAGLEGGADDYVVKPFDIEELLLRIRNMVDSRRRIRERYEARSLVLPELPSLSMPRDADAEATAFMEALREAVLANIADEELDVERVAKALAMSRATLYRRAETMLECSPMDLIWRVRLEQAALWLRDTEASVAEIAYGVGFKSVPHFSRRFKERFGETPTVHRRGAASQPG